MVSNDKHCIEGRLRFVIQEHFTDKHHFDLMLEKDGVLKTWQVNIALDSVTTQIEVLQLKDHRRLYLDYEGPISDNRGSVKIWDKGTYIVEEWSDENIIVSLLGEKLSVKISLARKEPLSGLWSLVCLQ